MSQKNLKQILENSRQVAKKLVEGGKLVLDFILWRDFPLPPGTYSYGFRNYENKNLYKK